MAITRLTQHDTHPMRVHLTRTTSKHYAALRCCHCDTHIQWLSREDADSLNQLGIEVVSKETTHD
jgi:hypothetical protein